jgi:hypothetical protein
VLAYVLNNLTPAYKGLVTIITQLFRQNLDEMNTETLFSSLINESRRQISAEKVLYSNKLKYKNNTKTQKLKYCNKCKVTTHATNSCWYLHLEKNLIGLKHVTNTILLDNPQKLQRQ